MRPSLSGALLILDHRPGHDSLLVSLSRLVEELERVFPDLLDVVWTIRGPAGGYGAFVGDLVERLETEPGVDVLGGLVMNALRSGDDWFDDVTIHVRAHAIDFGVHDSTALFFRGRADDMRAIAARFDRTRSPE